MLFHRAFRLARLVSIALIYCALTACGTSGHPMAKPIGIFVHPHSASAYAQTNQDRIVFTVLVEYSDGKDEPATGGVDWEQTDGFWAGFDTASSTGICHYSAPQAPFFGPKPAVFKASMIFGGQSFSDTAQLYCF